MESQSQNEAETNLNDRLLQETVCAILTKGGLNGYTLKRDENSQIGLNFMGSIVELVVQKNNGNSLNIVAKCGLRNKALYERFDARTPYEIEHYMYDEFLPSLRKYQLVKLDPDRVFPHIGEYYGSSLGHFEEVFVFENLKKRGFTTRDSKVMLDGPHVKIVLEELAGYHAACFTFKDQKADEWKKLISNENIGGASFFFRNDQFQAIALRRLKKLKTVFENEDERELAIHLGFFIDNIDEHVDAFTTIDKHSIVNHGDVWCSNVMFKYGDIRIPNRPTEIKLIDWQGSRVGHLCIDLAYFLYMSASCEILDDFDHYLKFYYEKFSERVRGLDSDPDRLFPYDVFEEQWRVCTPYAIIVVSNVLITSYMESDEFPDLVAVAESGGNIYRCVDVDFRRVGDYNKRMKTLVKLSIERKSF